MLVQPETAGNAPKLPHNGLDFFAFPKNFNLDAQTGELQPKDPVAWNYLENLRLNNPAVYDGVSHYLKMQFQHEGDFGPENFDHKYPEGPAAAPTIPSLPDESLSFFATPDKFRLNPETQKVEAIDHVAGNFLENVRLFNPEKYTQIYKHLEGYLLPQALAGQKEANEKAISDALKAETRLKTDNATNKLMQEKFEKRRSELLDQNMLTEVTKDREITEFGVTSQILETIRHLLNPNPHLTNETIVDIINTIPAGSKISAINTYNNRIIIPDRDKVLLHAVGKFEYAKMTQWGPACFFSEENPDDPSKPIFRVFFIKHPSQVKTLEMARKQYTLEESGAIVEIDSEVLEP